MITDLLVLASTVTGSQALWLALDRQPLLRVGGAALVPSLILTGAIVVGWVWWLAVFATRERRYLGVGSAEYRAVVNASLRLFTLTLLIVFLFQLRVGRGALLTAFIAGVLGLLAGRWVWRKWLARQRRHGAMSSVVLVAGSATSVAHLVTELRRAPAAGYAVVGACVPSAERDAPALSDADVPALGTLGEIIEVMERHGADTLAVASTSRLSPQRVKELSWQLEPGRQHLVVAPSIMDIGGPRIRMRPVAGLPLIHVETPKFERGEKVVKRTLDLVGSVLGLVLLSPVLLVVAALVRLSGAGPILFRQTRVGLDGEPFVMLKFRTMVADAEAALGILSAFDRVDGNEVLFKMRDDPRVTPVGRFLRRHSLDELPQLLNVLVGSMSLVGPRPPLQREVERYEDHVHRRFLMKPGITGLWQVNGRSNLSWEDSVRLDLYYVENWSLVGDLLILWKTVIAVLRRDGAY